MLSAEHIETEKGMCSATLVAFMCALLQAATMLTLVPAMSTGRIRWGRQGGVKVSTGRNWSGEFAGGGYEDKMKHAGSFDLLGHLGGPWTSLCHRTGTNLRRPFMEG